MSDDAVSIEKRAEMCSPKPVDVLYEIVGHLGAAVQQSVESDDQVIMGHVRTAHELATLLWKAQRK